jgi:hypothetical protein
VLRTGEILTILWDRHAGPFRGRLAGAPVAGHTGDTLRRHCRQADGCGQEDDGKRGAKAHDSLRERPAGRVGRGCGVERLCNVGRALPRLYQVAGSKTSQHGEHQRPPESRETCWVRPLAAGFPLNRSAPLPATV